MDKFRTLVPNSGMGLYFFVQFSMILFISPFLGVFYGIYNPLLNDVPMWQPHTCELKAVHYLAQPGCDQGNKYAIMELQVLETNQSVKACATQYAHDSLIGGPSYRSGCPNYPNYDGPQGRYPYQKASPPFLPLADYQCTLCLEGNCADVAQRFAKPSTCWIKDDYAMLQSLYMPKTDYWAMWICVGIFVSALFLASSICVLMINYHDLGVLTDDGPPFTVGQQIKFVFWECVSIAQYLSLGQLLKSNFNVAPTGPIDPVMMWLGWFYLLSILTLTSRTIVNACTGHYLGVPLFNLLLVSRMPRNHYERIKLADLAYFLPFGLCLHYIPLLTLVSVRCQPNVWFILALSCLLITLVHYALTLRNMIVPKNDMTAHVPPPPYNPMSIV